MWTSDGGVRLCGCPGAEPGGLSEDFIFLRFFPQGTPRWKQREMHPEVDAGRCPAPTSLHSHHQLPLWGLLRFGVHHSGCWGGDGQQNVVSWGSQTAGITEGPCTQVLGLCWSSLTVARHSGLNQEECELKVSGFWP